MPWFRVDDTFAMHEKTLIAGNAAIGLWTRAGSWSMQQLTDGFVPNHIVRALGTPRERKNLVNAGLWENTSDGVQFVNWSERNPSKDQVETARQAAAERQRHARERAKSQRESRRDTSVSHGPPNPTQPNPTHKRTGRDSSASAQVATHDPETETHTPAQQLVGEWIDHCGNRPPSAVIGQISKQVKQLLEADSIPYPDVRRGLIRWQERGLHPSTLPSVVHEVRTAQPPKTRQQEANDDFLARAMARAVEADRAHGELTA